MSIRIHTNTLARRGLMAAALSAAALGATSGVASALSSSAATTANVGVTSGIALTGLTSSFTLTGAPGSTVTGLAAVAYNVQTNDVAGYTVTVQSATPTLVAQTGGNSNSIPIANLTVRGSGSGAYSALSNTTPVTVHSQSGRSANGGDNLTSDYQITVPVVNADTYSATLNYVGTAS